MKHPYLKAALCVCAIAMTAAVGTPAPAHAQQADVQTQSQDGAWTPLPGTAVDISINAAGQAYAVSPGGSTWHWDAEQQRWRPMSGKFARITAAEGNRPWAVNADGVVFRYNGLWWEDKGTDVADVAADALGNVYIAKEDGSIHKWNPLRSEWRPVDGAARRIALGASGALWAVRRDGSIAVFDGDAWKELPGRARDIAVGGEDGAVIADAEGLVRAWNADRKQWIARDGVRDAIAVAAAPDGGPWVALASGAIMAQTLLVAPQRIKEEQDTVKTPHAPQAHAPVESATPAIPPSAQAAPVVPVTPAPSPVVAATPAAPTAVASVPQPPSSSGAPAAAGPATVQPTRDVSGSDPASATFTGAITFVDTRKSASTLAIGADGSVFGLVGGNVVRWSNTYKRFESFPGSLVRIAVDPDGHPWGISALGRVFRHDGQMWKQIHGASASDIAIGYDGTIITANASSQLYKLNSSQTRFELISGQGAAVAVAPDGTPWAIRSDRLVQRCDTSPCTILTQKALSLSIGPDGSVWIVSDNNQLMRLKPDGKSFEIIRTPGHTPSKVAAGPNGYPWVVSDANVALAAQFFERDETGDRATASATAGDTTGSGASATVSSSTASAFTFSKNMRFETVDYSTLSSSAYAVLASDFDGVIWAATTGGAIDKYSATRKKFIDAETKFSTEGYDVASFDIAPNGDIWAYIINPPTGLFRERNNVLKEYSVSGLTIGNVAVSPEGTVYADFYTGGTHYIYSKASDSDVFKKFKQVYGYGMAVGPGEDLWIIDGSNYVYQWTGSKFEKRPGSGQQANKIAISKTNGTVYIIDTSNIPRKWNSANQSFDKINNITGYYIAVDDEGRPWINTDVIPTIKRAKD